MAALALNTISVPDKIVVRPVPQLRPYQDKLLAQLSHSLQRHTSTVLQLPTGGGKTHIAVEHARRERDADGSVWFICHRREIIKQTADALADAGVQFGILAPGHKLNRKAAVQIGSIGFLRGRVGLLPSPKTIIWDECHHLAAPSWSKLKALYPEAQHIGLTATPLRLDGLGLDEFFNDMLIGPDTRQLIEWGFLSPYRLFAPTVPDLRGVKQRFGDYSRKQLAERMTDAVLTGDVVEHYKRRAGGAKALVFAVSRTASRDIVDRFNAAGIPAAHVDAETPTEDRDEAIAALARGDIKVMSNVEIFTEGFDLPAIGAVILLRPTKSLTLFRQMVGRGLRSDDGKEETVILDHAGLFYEHGMPDDYVQWSLEGSRRVAADRIGDAKKLRRCPECSGVHAFGPTCEHCGHVYSGSERAIDEVFGELMEVRRRPGWAFQYEFARIVGAGTNTIRKMMDQNLLPHDANGMIPIHEGTEAFRLADIPSSPSHPPRGMLPGEYENQTTFGARFGEAHMWVQARRKEGLPVADNGWVHVERGLAWTEGWLARKVAPKVEQPKVDPAEVRKLAGLANHVEFGAVINRTSHQVRKFIKHGMPIAVSRRGGGLVMIAEALAWLAKRPAESGRPLKKAVRVLNMDAGYHPSRLAAAPIRPLVRRPDGGVGRKLTNDEARTIRSLAGSVSKNELSRRYGVSTRTIRDLIAGKIYRDAL